MQFHIFKVENLMAEIKSTLANVKEDCKQTGPNYSDFLSHVEFNIIMSMLGIELYKVYG